MTRLINFIVSGTSFSNAHQFISAPRNYLLLSNRGNLNSYFPCNA